MSHPGEDTALFGGAGSPSAPPLPWSANSLRFEYAAPFHDAVERTRFQVRLEGNDREWSPWTSEGYREYTNLPEGAYRFRVRARNLWGTVSEEAVYAFCAELWERHSVEDTTYQAALEHLGERGLVELVAALGLYTAVAMTVSAFEIPDVT